MAFKPSASKPPGAPLRAKQRSVLVDSEDAELLEASPPLDTPRKDGVQIPPCTATFSIQITSKRRASPSRSLAFLLLLMKLWSANCRSATGEASEAMALPGGAGTHTDSLLHWQRVPEELPAKGGVHQRPGVPPHHLRLPPGGHSRPHHVRHGLVLHG